MQDQGFRKRTDFVQWIDVTVDGELTLQAKSWIPAKNRLETVECLPAPRNQENVQSDIHSGTCADQQGVTVPTGGTPRLSRGMVALKPFIGIDVTKDGISIVWVKPTMLTLT